MSEAIFDIERAVLGSLINKPDLIVSTLERLPPVNFSGPHQILAEALQGMADFGEEITGLTLLNRLRTTGLLNRVGGGGIIHSLMQLGYDAGAESLVDVLEAEAMRRELRKVGSRIVQRTENPTVEPEEILAASIEELGQIEHLNTEIEMLGWPSGDIDPEPEWVIPSLLAVDERVMITGKEGLGKSMLIRQLVASVAVGKHPFLFSSFEPKPALHVDLENPRSVSDAAYRRIRNGLLGERIEVPDLLYRLEPRIFDVEDARDVAWLMRAVRQIRPALIAIGPLKNMTSGDLNEEKAAVKVQLTLNRVRAETGAALIVEAHAGHAARNDGGDWRVRGNSSLLGWPEAGLGMKPISQTTPRAAQLVEWRGSRTAGRYWPEYLVEGTVWPWVEDPRIGEL